VAPRFTLGELASRVGGRVRGEAGTILTGLRPLEEAGPGDLTFLGNVRYKRGAAASRAGAILTSPGLAPSSGVLLLVENPYAALGELLELFHPQRPRDPSVSDRAVIAPDALIGRDVSIGPLAVIGPRCRIGDRVQLRPCAVLGEECEIGDDSILHANVSVYPHTWIGRRVIVHSGAVLGSDGYGYATVGGKHRKIPQVGRLRVEDDVEIGANVTVDRGSLGETVIGRGTKIDNLVQVAHNVRIGEDCLLVAQSGIAGSTRLGARVTIAGQSGTAGHLEIGEGAIIASKTAVYRDLPPGAFVAGIPALDHMTWKRAQASFARLAALRSEVRALSRRVEELERRPGARGRSRKGARGTEED